MFFGVFLREKQTGPTFVGAGIPKQCVVGSATTLKKTAGFSPQCIGPGADARLSAMRAKVTKLKFLPLRAKGKHCASAL